MYHLAKCLKDTDQDFLRGAIWELAFLFAEPTTRKSLQVDGVRALSRQSLVHILGVAEERVPVMACGEVNLILYCTHLRETVEHTGGINSAASCQHFCHQSIKSLQMFNSFKSPLCEI